MNFFNLIRCLISYFSEVKKLTILNALLIAFLIVCNIYFQAFCIPTNWAIIILSICFANTIVYPLLEKTILSPLISFINGISLFVFLYCVLFLEQINYFGLLFIFLGGIGFLVFIPHFMIIQLIWKNLISPKKYSSRYFFLLAIIICTGTVIYIGQVYKKAIVSFSEFKKNNYTMLEKSFMTEKILGMHFIYHTRYCEYDGWRPPKHEPTLVIGMWLNKRIDPLQVDLITRLELYKKNFPDYKYKFDCSCAIAHRQDYFQDKLWSK